jgi:hypothetical protein
MGEREIVSVFGREDITIKRKRQREIELSLRLAYLG